MDILPYKDLENAPSKVAAPTSTRLEGFPVHRRWNQPLWRKQTYLLLYVVALYQRVSGQVSGQVSLEKTSSFRVKFYRTFVVLAISYFHLTSPIQHIVCEAGSALPLVLSL